MDKPQPYPVRAFAILFAFAVLALALAPLASQEPDGLAFAADALQFNDSARESAAPNLATLIGTWPARVAGMALAGMIAGLVVFLKTQNGKPRDHHHGTIRNP